MRLLLLCCFTALIFTYPPVFAQQNGDPGHIGHWTLDIDGGGVGWLSVEQAGDYLDGALLWRGGSVLPVAHISYDKPTGKIIATRVQQITRKAADGKERLHTVTNFLEGTITGDEISGTYTEPGRNGDRIVVSKFKGRRLPPVPPAPKAEKWKFGAPIKLFNGTDLTGWKLTNLNQTNGFKVENGILVNDPVQTEGQPRISYGNIRTDEVFRNFNLKLEVNVPQGSNSGIYLRGMYEVQVMDSYGRALDSHNMGAVYSRITPTVAAEKPAGTWQSLDITLYDRHVTVILNGQKIIDNQAIEGPTGGAIQSDVFAPGPVYLQGDHGKVSYRNMVLTPILN